MPTNTKEKTYRIDLLYEKPLILQTSKIFVLERALFETIRI